MAVLDKGEPLVSQLNPRLIFLPSRGPKKPGDTMVDEELVQETLRCLEREVDAELDRGFWSSDPTNSNHFPNQPKSETQSTSGPNEVQFVFPTIEVDTFGRPLVDPKSYLDVLIHLALGFIPLPPHIEELHLRPYQTFSSSKSLDSKSVLKTTLCELSKLYPSLKRASFEAQRIGDRKGDYWKSENGWVILEA